MGVLGKRQTGNSEKGLSSCVVSSLNLMVMPQKLPTKGTDSKLHISIGIILLEPTASEKEESVILLFSCSSFGAMAKPW